MRWLLVASLTTNVLLVTVLAVPIVRDRRDHDDRFDIRKIAVLGDSGPLKVIPPALDSTRTVTVSAQPAPVERPKPPIAGRDIRSGKRVALAQFGGRPVIVSVWGSWNVGSLAQASRIGRF